MWSDGDGRETRQDKEKQMKTNDRRRKVRDLLKRKRWRNFISFILMKDQSLTWNNCISIKCILTFMCVLELYFPQSLNASNSESSLRWSKNTHQPEEIKTPQMVSERLTHWIKPQIVRERLTLWIKPLTFSERLTLWKKSQTVGEHLTLGIKPQMVSERLTLNKTSDGQWTPLFVGKVWFFTKSCWLSEVVNMKMSVMWFNNKDKLDKQDRCQQKTEFKDDEGSWSQPSSSSSRV